MVKILAFPGTRNATRAEDQAPTGTDLGPQPLLSATPDGTLIIAASPRPATSFPQGDWSNQELADLYRVEALLVQANIRISTGRGLTDEGDPWFVFCKEDGDVFVHLARTEGSYLLDSPGLGEILHGSAFTVLIERFIQVAAAKAIPPSNIVTLRPRMARDSVVRLHPAVMLAALVWSLYLASSKFGGVAHAADGHAEPEADAAHGHVGHDTPSPADIDGALAHLVDHLPKSGTTPVVAPAGERTALLDAGDKNSFDLRGAISTAAAGFSSQGVAASLTVIAFSYGLYLSADDQHLSGEAIAKAEPLPAPAEENHVVSAPEVSAVIALMKQSSPHDTQPAVATDVAAADDSNLKPALPKATSETSHAGKLAADLTSSPGMTHAAVTYAQTTASSFLLHQDDNNIVLDKLLSTPSKTIVEASKNGNMTADTQSVLGLINHYLGGADVFKIGGLTVSTTFNINDLDKVMSHLTDTSDSQPVAAINNALLSSSAAASEPQMSSELAASAAPAHSATPYAHYDDQAKQFVTHFIQESNSIQMVQFNSTIVLVDMSALGDPNEQIYTRSWSTDDGHVISTIGHLQDFATQGMV
jgi:hypothetical protein